MQWFRECVCRILATLHSPRLDREAETELQLHLDLETEAGMRRGLTYSDARRAAHLRLGKLVSARETIRERRGFALLERLLQDFRYAARALRQNVALTATIVATLTLGIGANTAIFSFFDAILLRSLPVTRPEELVILKPIQANGSAIISYPVLQEIQARQDVLTGLLATSDVERMTVQFEGAQQPTRLMGDLVSGNYFNVLGVPMAVGRAFSTADEKLEAPRLTVISNGLWKRRFGSDPAIIGHRLIVNGAPTTIIGITSRDFLGDTPGLVPDVWVLLTQFRPGDLHNRAGTFFEVMGRLRPGVRLKRAQAALTVLYQQSMAAELAENSSTAASL